MFNLHKARGSDCVTCSNCSHEKSIKDKLGLMNETSQTKKAHPAFKKKRMGTIHTERFVGIYIHKRHVVVAAVDKQQKVLPSPKKISNQQFASWAYNHLKPIDKVALLIYQPSFTISFLGFINRTDCIWGDYGPPYRARVESVRSAIRDIKSSGDHLDFDTVHERSRFCVKWDQLANQYVIEKLEDNHNGYR